MIVKYNVFQMVVESFLEDNWDPAFGESLCLLFLELSRFSLPDKGIVFEMDVFDSLVQRFQTGNHRTQGLIAVALANCCTSSENQNKLLDSLVLDFVLRNLFSEDRKVQYLIL